MLKKKTFLPPKVLHEERCLQKNGYVRVDRF